MNPRVLSLAVASLALAPVMGCKSGRSDADALASAAPSASAMPPELPKFAATIDDKRLPLQFMVATKSTTKAITISMSSQPIECTDVLRDGTPLRDGESRIQLKLAPLLSPDGQTNWRMTGQTLAEIAESGNLAPVAVMASDTSPGGHTVVRVRRVGSYGDASGRKHEFVLHGPVDALGCGVRPGHGGALAPAPQPALTLTVAGIVFPIAGATVSTDGADTVLWLSSAPHDCARADETDVELRLTLRGGVVTRAALRGDQLPGTLDRTFEAKDKGFKMKPAKAVAGATSVDVDLEGRADVGSFPIVVTGAVNALVCK